MKEPLVSIPLNVQRDNFAKLNSLELDRISEGLNYPDESEWSIKIACSDRNVDRNRYTNVFPWDKTRVKLPVINGGSDYINASYISVNDEKPSYILTQGPLVRTVHHFWAMCFSESEKQKNDVVIIAMVTPLVELNVTKCNRYWPINDNEELDFTENLKKDSIDLPGLSIKQISSTYNSDVDYLVTILELKSGDKVKTVYHYYYFKWADSKVPSSVLPLVSLSKEIAQIKLSVSNTPIPIVHCSAGVGRTGTLITLDQLLHNKTLYRSKDPIMEIVSQLRSSRMMMVQTVYQFNFLYEVLMNYIEKQSLHN
ncbi:uncharacterized protein PRCAT00005175001 [Priceomyces carsonii]|uniref:uncharacterized protein n=1 Tax=Priceomyces carsonii TaxID=28549 RepID=UPI002ED78D9A|nr:unnamed protein product [Priceomyces carsonii]